MTYAITGITGQVGSSVARHLLAAGRPVRAIVRDRAKGASWAQRGCELVVAQIGDAESLVAAFEGAQGVFVLLPPLFDPSPGFAEAAALIESLRQALERTRPGRVVALSTIGADADRPNLLNALRMMEQAFASLPIPVTFLRAAWFMENAAWDLAAARSGAIQSHLQPLDRRIAMISTEDVGHTAAMLLQEHWQGRRVVELESRQRVSPNDIASAFAESLGRPIQVSAVPRDQWEKQFVAQGMRNPQPRMQMIDGFNEGWIDFVGRERDARKGGIGIEEAVATIVARCDRNSGSLDHNQTNPRSHV